MPYIILFEDAENIPADLRQRHLDAHLDFLEANSDRITAAGPLHSTEGTGAGGLWLVDTETPEDAEALIRVDPFWPTGLRKSWRILRWTQVYADGKRRIEVG